MRTHLLITALVTTSLAWSGPVQASATCADSSPTVYAPATNAQPAQLIIHCPFAGNATDQVVVYDRDGDMPSSGSIATLADFDHDLWVFDARGDGTANLILEFQPEGAALVAHLYDDQNGDGRVSFTFQEGQVRVTESAHPTVRVQANAGWWQQADQTNFNLDLTVDGPVYAAFGAELYYDSLTTDARPDFAVQVRDANEDGRPERELIQAMPPLPESSGVIRTALMVNTQDNEPPITGFIFWPYLGTAYAPPLDLAGSALLTPDPAVTYGFVKDYGRSFPPIQVWWPDSRLAYVGEFVASRGNEHNWFIYSLQRFGTDQARYANFENPFAFYDLAADGDGLPELQIRVEHYGLGDPFFRQGTFAQPIQTVRYSWDQANTQHWDYKLDLIGRHAIETVETFPDFAIQTVPYADYPTWVTEQAWDSVEWVAVEKPGYWTTEGVYEAFVNKLPTRDFYITGLTNTVPMLDLASWPIGLRSEYNPALQAQPRLYLSAVDHKLHLLNAQAGVWKLDELQTLQYANLGGAHLNHWALQKNAEPMADLYVAAGHILYADAGGLSLTQNLFQPALLTTLPPRNHAEWAELGATLTAQAAPFAPADLKAMFQQFGGPGFAIANASLQSFRQTPTGFRLVVNLAPGFVASGTGMALGTFAHSLRDLAPGPYLISYAERFTIEPLTPAQLELAPGTLRVDTAAPQALVPLQIAAQLHNAGLADVPHLLVQAQITGPAAEPTVLTTTLTLEGEQTTPLRFTWTPPTAGEWRIALRWEAPEVAPATLAVLSAAQITVLVAQPTPPNLETISQTSNLPQPSWLVALLIGLGLSATALGLFFLRNVGQPSALPGEPDA